MSNVGEIAGLLGKFYETQVEILNKQAELMREIEKQTLKLVSQPQQQITKTVPGTRKKKIAEDPNKPKRSKTAYVLFVTEKMSDVKRNNPGINQRDAFSAIAKEWGALNAEEKADYNRRASENKLIFEKQMEEYMSHLKDGDVVEKEKLVAEEDEEEEEEEEDSSSQESEEEETGEDEDEEEEEDDDEGIPAPPTPKKSFIKPPVVQNPSPGKPLVSSSSGAGAGAGHKSSPAKILPPKSTAAPSSLKPTSSVPSTSSTPVSISSASVAGMNGSVLKSSVKKHPTPASCPTAPGPPPQSSSVSTPVKGMSLSKLSEAHSSTHTAKKEKKKKKKRDNAAVSESEPTVCSETHEESEVPSKKIKKEKKKKKNMEISSTSEQA